MSNKTWEVELKFHVPNPVEVQSALMGLGFEHLEDQHHEDVYLRHPCRDFVKTDEAFRLRRMNDQAVVTYKGPRASGPVKTRQEIELTIQAVELEQWKLLVDKLGFQQVVPVRKFRRLFVSSRPQFAEMKVTLDRVEQLGDFAEIEIIVDHSEAVSNAEKRVVALAQLLSLNQPQPRSYLSLLLEHLGE